MIGWIEGTALSADIVKTASGVGYRVHCARDLAVGEHIELHVTTVVRDDAILLYGFAAAAEQVCFADLIKAPGVGPQIALNLLRDLGVTGVCRAVAGDDVAALRTVAGVGPALAKKLAANVTFSQAVVDAAADDDGDDGAGPFDAMTEAVAATLEGIGIDRATALEAAQLARAELPDGDESAVLGRALAATREAA